MRVTTWGPVGRHSNKETWPTNVGYVALFDTVEEYRESYTSTARAYIMPVIMEALVLIVVCVVTYALVMRAAERS